MFVKLEGDGVLYQQLYHALRRAILSGALAAGTRLPSTRTLARELGVSRNTVLLAYDQLLAEGYTVSHTGSGTYVASTLPDVMHAPPSTPESSRDAATATLPQLSAYGRRLLDSAPPTAPALAQHPHPIRYDFRYGVPAVAEFPRPSGVDCWLAGPAPRHCARYNMALLKATRRYARPLRTICGGLVAWYATRPR